MSKAINVLVVDDSPLMRLVISNIIKESSDIAVLETAENGKVAFEKTQKLKPDVILTDLTMPEYDGEYLVRAVMRDCPTPILVLSGMGESGNKVFELLDHGAYDFIEKPDGSNFSSIRGLKDLIYQKIKNAANVPVAELLNKSSVTQRTQTHTFGDTLNYDIISIGSSTGGPSALEAVISNLPGNLKVPVVIAQHMPARFIESFSTRLNKLTPLNVKIGEQGEMLRGGTVYIAQGFANMRVDKDVKTGFVHITYTRKSYKEFNNPSVNCLLESVADVYKDKTLGIILTGMGRDGTTGMEKIYNFGGYTIAQDESTSVVFGMPKSAIDSGCVKQVVKLKEIPSFIVSCL